MKKIFKYSCIVALFMLGTIASAQDNGINLRKKVTGSGGEYNLTLEAYVTGTSQTTVTEEVMPCDIAIILDLSSSMKKNSVTVYERGSRILTGRSLQYNTNYFIEINGKQYYLRGFRSGTPGNRTYTYQYASSVPSSENDGVRLYQGNSEYIVKATDVIYSVSSSSKTRLQAIKEAAQQFVETVAANSPETEYHKIAVIGYNSKGATLVSLQDVTSTSKGTIKTSIGGIDTDSISGGDSYYTDPAQGLKQAANVFNAVKTDGRKKVVVFFTDGDPCPSGTDDFSAVYATNAVNWAYILKQPNTKNISYSYNDSETFDRTTTASSNDSYSGTGYDASVYSVAVLGQEDAQVRHFLHWVSSNYKDKYFGSSRGTFTGAEGNEAPHDYYQLSDGSDLTSIFDKIASEASTGGASTKLTAETTTVVDVVAADFTLPEGADVNSIQVFTAPAKNQAPYDSAGRKWYTFGARTPLGATVTIGEDADHNPKVTVKGFDFSKDDTSVDAHDGNWVGDRKKNGSIIGYYGRELVIVIPIKLKPDYQGGYETPTNTTQSGIYQEGKDDPIAVFNVPTVDFPSIAIVKKGLKKGESATFTVTRTTALKMDDDGKVVYGSDGYPETVPGIQAPYRVILTGTGDDSGAYIVLKDVIEGDYVIREEGWSWAYEVQTANSQVGRLLCKKNFENDNIEFHGAVDFHGTKCMIFNFENAAKTDAPDHAEAKVNNDFSKNTATTVTSKEQPASR